MSYYTINPSTPAGYSGATFTEQQNPEYMAAMQQPTGGFRTRSVNGNELVQNQLTGLLDSGSSYIQQARNQAAQQASSRGLLNSSIAAGAGQGAAIQAGLPIATSDADTYARTHGANMDAENQYLLAKMQAQTSRQNANVSAGASINVAKLNAQTQANALAEQQRQYNATLANQQAQYGTDWQHQQQTMQQQNQMNQQNYLYTGLFSNVMNNPDMWSDPQAAMGFANYFGSNFNNLWNSMFGGGKLPAAATP